MAPHVEIWSQLPHIVADMGLADWGRKKLKLQKKRCLGLWR